MREFFTYVDVDVNVDVDVEVDVDVDVNVNVILPISSSTGGILRISSLQQGRRRRRASRDSSA